MLECWYYSSMVEDVMVYFSLEMLLHDVAERHPLS